VSWKFWPRITKNATLAIQLNAKIQECANKLNVNFSLEYAENKKMFLFSFPSNDQVVLSLFLQKPELSLQMGYFHSNVIHKDSGAHKVKDRGLDVNEADAFNKCKALCCDTGIVLCTLDQASSNTTSKVLDICMASLFPDQSGIMEMVRCGSGVPPGVVLVSSSGWSAMVPFTFQLLRICDNQEICKFAWTDGAYVNSALMGICGNKFP